MRNSAFSERLDKSLFSLDRVYVCSDRRLLAFFCFYMDEDGSFASAVFVEGFVEFLY